jgi:hypothetical protein
MTQTNSRIWNILWWSYFALLAIATISSWFRVHSLSDALLAVFGGFGLVGLWGYLRRVNIGWPKFWIAYFILFTTYALYSIGLIAWLAWQAHAVTYYYVAIGAALLVTPQGLALWRYGFRSGSLWRVA